MNTDSAVALLQDYWHQHGIIGLLAGWVVISGVMNLMFRLKSPSGWMTWADSNPRIHVVVDVVRGWGVDPAAALEALQVYAQKKAEAETAAKNEEKK